MSLTAVTNKTPDYQSPAPDQANSLSGGLGSKSAPAKKSKTAANQGADTDLGGLVGAQASPQGSSIQASSGPDFMVSLAQAEAQSKGQDIPLDPKLGPQSSLVPLSQGAGNNLVGSPVLDKGLNERATWLDGKDPRFPSPAIKASALEQSDLPRSIDLANKPWSKNWVFDGSEEQNMTLKPLFDKTRLDSAIEQLRHEQGAPQAGAPINGQANVVGGADASALASLIAQMGGEAELSGEEAETPVTGGISKTKNAEVSAKNNLSGSDFLATRQVAQNSAQQTQARSGIDGANGLPFGLPVSERSDDLLARRNGSGASPNLTQNRSDAAQLAAGTAVTAGALAKGGKNEMPPEVLSGQVVRGSMSQQRLSHESLQAISSGIQSMTNNGLGGGEMKITLRPDALGELRLLINTQGNQVGIKIHASDQKAREILEQSISHLRESLSSHQLELSRVELLSVGGQVMAASDSQNSSNQGGHSDRGHQDAAAHAQNMLNGNLNSNGGNGKNGEAAARWLAKDPGSALSSSSVKQAQFASAGVTRGGPRGAGAGRLDVIA